MLLGTAVLSELGAAPKPHKPYRTQAGPVVEQLAERMADPDAGVRAALQALLSGTVLRELGAGALAPFLPLLMAHVSAAMTNLAAPIRCTAGRSC